MKFWRCVLLILLIAWNGSTDLHMSYAADLYHGRVVDEETGQPLSGAVLTVVWFRRPIIGLEGTRDFLSAQEAVADSDGKFSLVASPGIDWSPFTYVEKEPKIVIYQPGYEPTWAGWLVRNKYGNGIEFAEALKNGATVKLPKLKTKDEFLKFVNPSSLTHVVVSREAIPKLIQLVNIQRKMAGLTSFYSEETKGGRKP